MKKIENICENCQNRKNCNRLKIKKKNNNKNYKNGSLTTPFTKRREIFNVSLNEKSYN